MSSGRTIKDLSGAAEDLMKNESLLMEFSDHFTEPAYPMDQILTLALEKTYYRLFQPIVADGLYEQVKKYWIPIANNLGMWKIRYFLEDRIFEVTDRKNYQLMCSLVKRKQKIHQQLFENVVKIVTYYLKESGLRNFEIFFRQKNIYGIYTKMKRRSQNINTLTDCFGIRILTDTIPQCYKATGILHHLWRPYPEFFKDYIKHKKPNGYQSIHTTLHCLEGQMVEFQVRTKKMDLVAKYGSAAHGLYKRLNS